MCLTTHFNNEKGTIMESKHEILERVATNFTQLDEEMKEKIAWYMLGRQEEREKWENSKRIA